jgi:hypothetical protein
MGALLEDTTEETLAAITKAQTTGILESTGAYSYDLTGIVRLIPVVTPFRDKLARESSPDGNKFAIWRAFIDATRSQPRATPGFDYAANEVLFSAQDFQARYQPVSLAGIVTQDAFDLAKGLYDPYAETTMQVLNQTLIAEDKLLIGGQSYALPQPGTLTLTQVGTGGSIGTVTSYVGVAARTGSGYFWGGNSRARTGNTVFASGTTNSINASIAAVKGAVAYDWFYSANGSTWFYVRTTTIASTTITAVQASDATPSNFANPDISSVVPTLNAAADNGSANAAEFDGLIASLTGDYTGAGLFTTSGTANANGATFIDGGGAALTLTGGSVTQIENLFQAIWNAVKCSPTALMVNSIQAQEIANLVLGGTSATTFLTTDEQNRISTTAGGRVGQIVNTPAGGVTVPIEVHTSLPAGTIIARTDRVPFPQANISATLAVRTLRDYSQFDYATNRVAATAGGGPRKEFEIRSVEAFINRAPVAMGILSNIV